MASKKRLSVKIEKWALDELDRLLKTPYCQDRGFDMKREDLLEEMIANWENLTKHSTWVSRTRETNDGN